MNFIVLLFSLLTVANADRKGVLVSDSSGCTRVLTLTDTSVRKCEYASALEDTGKKKTRPNFQWEDRRVDASQTEPYSPLLLRSPSNVELIYEMTPDGKGFYVYERVGNRNVRPPAYITADEYRRRMDQQQRQEYFRRKAATSLEQNKIENNQNVGGRANPLIPALNVNNALFKDIFGSGKIEIKPNVSVLLDFSGRNNRMQNPNLSIRQQNNTTFNFDQQIQLNVVGQIGEKLKLRSNYDTEASFNFENQFKTEFVGSEDDIIKSIEAGNVSLPLNGSLITGGQNLWGVKLAMQFGPVFVTTVASQQRGKTQEITVQGGAQQTEYQKKAAEYDENRHFFLCHFFKEEFDKALKDLPLINSRINVTRVEIWVTNRASTSTTNNRNGLGLIDLGENIAARGGVIWNDTLVTATGAWPSNTANNLYNQLSQDQGVRIRNTTVNALQQYGYRVSEDFELMENMRRLNENEYKLYPQLGFVTLNSRLQQNDVVFVAFEYTLVGDPNVYRVGEFSVDVPSNPNNTNVLLLKMIKPRLTRPTLYNRLYPTWDLMMKNIYSIGGFNLQPNGFDFQITYESTDGSGDVNFLPGSSIGQRPLIQVFGLDRLTNNSELGPDNRFDFINGVTVVSDKGLVMFPVREPFGRYFVSQLPADRRAEDSARFAYPQLYTRTQVDAIQYFPQLNRFKFRGRYQSASGNEIQLNAVQLVQGSVKVTAGGQRLNEGTDYTVDYAIGKVTILNTGIMAAGQDIKISFESNTLFGIDQKTMVGARVDYKGFKNLTFGGTILHLNERPLINKVILGDEPVSNTLWGFDLNFKKDSRLITNILDKLPFYDTKEVSTVTFQGEVAQLIPGHPRQLKNDNEKGIAYLDDFEGTRSVIDLLGVQSWKLAATPITIPEPNSSSLLRNGFKRAKLAWYGIDPDFFNRPEQYGYTNRSEALNFQYTRRVEPKEVFPNRTIAPGLNILTTLDLHYIPNQRGPYNYNTSENDINPDGTFKRPEEMWAGITRRTTGNTDFEAANFEFIEFWLMDPFDPEASVNRTGGDLYLNLGQVSEDVLKDNRRAYENGLPTNEAQNQPGSGVFSTTAWGRVPELQTPTNAFDNQPGARRFQDVGLDGVGGGDEASYFSDFARELSRFVTNGDVLARAKVDPSTDDYEFFRDEEIFSGQDIPIQTRYRNFNNLEGNSPEPVPGQLFSKQATQFPDVEDINADGTLNTTESYFEYKVRLRPGEMVMGRNYIVDVRETTVVLPNMTNRAVKWYMFRIPLQGGTRIGGVQDRKAIDFIRMYLTGFREPITLRFGKLDLVATQWRTYRDYLGAGDEGTAPDPSATVSDVRVGTLSVEENGNRLPFNYVPPPAILRQVVPGAAVAGILQNEQSLVLQACNLPAGDSRATFKTVNFDMRSYKNLKVWIHAEPTISAPNPNFSRKGDVSVFIRLGTDLNNNYYEYEKPLTPPDPGAGASDIDQIWRADNQINFALELLDLAKTLRNSAFNRNDPLANPSLRYLARATSEYKIYVQGNPQLNNVKNIMVGVRNTNPNGQPVCVEIWINEIRATDYNEETGWAATGRMNLKLADLGTVSLSALYSSRGFGSIETKINNRQRYDLLRYDVAGNLQLGKLLPKKLGIELPFFFTYGEKIITPQFNPLDPDVKMTTVLQAIENQEGMEAAQRKANNSIDYTRTIGYSFNNVRKLRSAGGGGGGLPSMQPISPGSSGKPGGGAKPGASKAKFYDIENFAFSYAFNETFQRNATIESWRLTNHKGGITYAYNLSVKPIYPFKIGSFGKKKNLLTDFSINPIPRTFSFRLDFDRHYEEQYLRQLSRFELPLAPTFQQNFTLTRTYNFSWDLTRSLSLNFNATNNGRVDEPRGRIDTPEERDTLWYNFFSIGRDESRNKFNLINMGRTIGYQQNIQIAYRLPFNLIKPLNWLSSQVAYGADYRWQTAALQYLSLGNTISNTGNLQIQGQMQFMNLYKKFPKIEKWLKPPPKKNVFSKADSSRRVDDDREITWKEVGRFFANLAFSIQQVDINFNKTGNTTIPGFLGRTDNFGLDWNFKDAQTQQTSLAPGVDFVMGSQPYLNQGGWFSSALAKGWLSQDTLLRAQFMQTENQNLTGRVNMVLFKGFKIDVNFTKITSKNISGLFSYIPIDQDSIDGTGGFKVSNYMETGSYSASFWSVGSAFGNGNRPWGEFQNDFRKVISDRLRNANPRYGELANPNQFGGYWNGYSGSQQDVMIPAFLAAYGPYKVNSGPLDAFPKIPFPNWNLTYNGLSELPFFRDYFKSIALTHSYKSTYTTNYVINLASRDRNRDGFPDPDATQLVGQIPTGSGDSIAIVNYHPIYTIQQVSIQEAFYPLIGLNFAWKNGLTTSFDFKRSRNIQLNVGALQLAEMRNTEMTINLNWRKDKMLKPLRILGKNIELKNSLTARFELTLRDTRMQNRRLDSSIPEEPTGGNYSLTIKPSIDYVFSPQLTVRGYFERNVNRPVLSTSFPTSFTAVGVQARFTLTQ